MKAKKTMTMALVACMSLVAIATTASASSHGALSRTFVDTAAVYGEWTGPGGLGWYDPVTPNNGCVGYLFGLTVPGSVVYWDGARVTQNDVNQFVGTFGPAEVPAACPIPVTPDNNVVGTTAFDVSVGARASQSALLCTNNFTSTCTVDDPDDARWYLYDCGGVLGVSFNAGSILGLLPAGSSSVSGGCSTTDRTNVTSFLSSDSTKLASFPDPNVQDVSTGSTYVVSCYTTTSKEFTSTGTLLLHDQSKEASHDYFLVLNSADAANFGTYMTHHLSGGGVLGHGLYDLVGDNGCHDAAFTGY